MPNPLVDRNAILQEELAKENALINSPAIDVSGAERPKTADERRVHETNIALITKELGGKSTAAPVEEPIEWVTPPTDSVTKPPVIQKASTQVEEEPIEWVTPPTETTTQPVASTAAPEEPIEWVTPPTQTEAPGILTSAAQGVVNIGTDIVETGLLGVGGVVAKAGELLGAESSWADPYYDWVTEKAKAGKTFILSEDEQKAMTLKGKIASGLGGVVPMVLMGPYGIATMAASTFFASGKGALEEGQDLGQAEATGLLNAAGVLALAPIPAVFKSFPTTITAGAGVNVAQQVATEKIIRDVILREDQTDIKARHDPWNVENAIVAGVVGGAVGGVLHAGTGVMKKVYTDTQESVAKKFETVLGDLLPTEIKYTIPTGVDPKDHLAARLHAGDASTHEIWDIIRQDPATPMHYKELMNVAQALGGDIGMDTARMRFWDPQDSYQGKPMGPYASKYTGGQNWSSLDISQIAHDFRTNADPYRQIIHEGMHGVTAGALHWYAKEKTSTNPRTPDQQRIYDRAAQMEKMYKLAEEKFIQKFNQGKDQYRIQQVQWTETDANGNTIGRVGLQKEGDFEKFFNWMATVPPQVKTPAMQAFFKHYYGMKNLREFPVEALVKGDLQKSMADVWLSPRRVKAMGPKPKSDLPNLWLKTKEAFKNLMKSTSHGYDHTLLDLSLDSIFGLHEDITNRMRTPILTHPNAARVSVAEGMGHTLSDIQTRLNKRTDDIRDRFEKVMKGQGLTGVEAHLLQRIAYLRGAAHTKEEFANRLAIEIPTEAWRGVVARFQDRLWNEPRFLLEAASKTAAQTDGVMAQWVKTDPNLNRFIEKILPGHTIAGDVVKEIHPADDLTTAGTWLLNPQTLRHIKKGPAGQVLRWVYDRTAEHVALKAILYARSMEHFEAFNKATVKQQFRILDVISQYQSKSEAARLEKAGETRIPDHELQNHGLTKDEIKIYKGMADGTDYLWSLIEQARTKLGKEPLKRIPAYMPHIWQGPYKVFVRQFKTPGMTDTGPVVEVKTFRTRWRAEAYVKELNSGKHDNGTLWHRPQEDAKTRLDYSVIKFKDATNTIGMTMQEHMAAYENVLLTDPNTLAILERIDRDAMRGLTKHMLERDDVKGWVGEKGSEYGKKVVNVVGLLTTDQQNMRLLYQNYAKNVTKFYTNTLYMDEVVSPLLDSIPPKGSNRPYYGLLFPKNSNLSKTIEEFALNFTGENLNKLNMVDENLQKGMITLGVDPLAYRRMNRSIKGWLAAMKLKLNPANYVANAFQPAMMGSILTLFNSHIQTEGLYKGKIPNPMVSMTKGFNSYHRPDKEHQELLTWLQEKHLADPQLAVELKQTGRSAGLETTEDNRNFWNWNTVIEGWGRKVSFIMAYDHMKQIYKDPAKAREAAANAMEMTMVNYDRSERPLMYQNLGVVGEFISPFAVYRNAYLGNTILALKAAQSGRISYTTLKPFLAMQMTYLALAGASGMVLMSEYDGLIDLIRSMFPEMWTPPKADELMADTPDWFGKDYMRYGMISGLTGVNMSNSMKAVAGDSMADLASVDFLSGIAHLVPLTGKAVAGTLGADVDQPTASEWMKPVGQVIPAVFRPYTNAFAMGGYKVKPMAQSPEAVTSLSAEEIAKEVLSGKPAISTQVRVDAINRDKAEERLVGLASKKLVNMAMEITTGRNTRQTYESVYARWAALTMGTPDEFQESIKQAMEGTYMTYMNNLLKSKKAKAQVQYEDTAKRGGLRGE